MRKFFIIVTWLTVSFVVASFIAQQLEPKKPIMTVRASNICENYVHILVNENVEIVTIRPQVTSEIQWQIDSLLDKRFYVDPVNTYIVIEAIGTGDTIRGRLNMESVKDCLPSPTESAQG